MAKIAPKGKKVNGTKKKDKITWVSSKPWKKNLTVKAGAGNDVINFKKSKYKNKLYGEAGNDKIYGGKKNDYIDGGLGNDIIYGTAGTNKLKGGKGKDKIFGGTGNDKIWGGTNNDTISAGKGNNTIYHNAGDGNDVIVSGKGTDTLVINGINPIDKITAAAVGNNLVITRTNGELITLKDYMKGNHSVKYVQYGGKTVKTEQIRNFISSGDEIVNGTAWHDDIYTNYNNDYVYAGEGNDNIYITEESNIPYVYLGKGNDTITLQAEKPSVYIYFENGDGNNTITGLYDGMDDNTNMFIISADLLREVNFGENLPALKYIVNKNVGNDLVLTLTGGDTLTIKDYNTLSNATKDTISVSYYGKNYNFRCLKDYLKDIITVGETQAASYSVTDNSKFVLAPDVIFARTFNINGSNNEIYITGQNTQTINLNSGDNELFVYNTGDTNTVANHNIVNINSENNRVYLSGGRGSEVNISGSYGSNTIYIKDGTDNVVTTSNGQNDVKIYATVDEYGWGQNTIYSNGTDHLELYDGNHNIYLTGNYDRSIELTEKTHLVEIYGVETAKSTTILSPAFIPMQDHMFEHYTSWKDTNNNDHIAIKYLYYTSPAVDMRMINIYGKWTGDVFSLDNETVADKVTIRVDNYRKLSVFSQYVDMNNSAIGTEGGYKKYTLGDGVLNIAKDVYVNGTTGDDYYTTGEKSILNLNKPFTVSDKGGNDDLLLLGNNYQNTRFFMDIDINQQIASDDLYIFYHSNDGIGNESGQIASGLYQFFSGNIDDYGEEKGYIVVENEFDSSEDTFTYGTGRIESINASDTVGGISMQNHFDTIKADVAGWLGAFNTAYDTSCDTVTEAIESGNNIWTVSYQDQNLYQIYSQPYNT